MVDANDPFRATMHPVRSPTQCRFDDGCTRPASGTVSAEDGPTQSWPKSLTGRMCSFPGPAVVKRAPHLDPTAQVTWTPDPET